MNSRLALIVFLDGGGGRPDNSLPGIPVYPDQGLPGFQPYPDQGLPGQGGRPDQGLPGSQPGPDNSLPGGRPNHPWWGGRFPNRPDNSLPWNPGRPDQGLPPFPSHLPVFPTDPSEPPKPGDPRPSHPIYEGRKFEVKWSPYYGWILVPADEDGDSGSGGGNKPAKPDQGLPATPSTKPSSR